MLSREGSFSYAGKDRTKQYAEADKAYPENGRTGENTEKYGIPRRTVYAPGYAERDTDFVRKAICLHATSAVLQRAYSPRLHSAPSPKAAIRPAARRGTGSLPFCKRKALRHSLPAAGELFFAEARINSSDPFDQCFSGFHFSSFSRRDIFHSSQLFVRIQLPSGLR